MPPDFGFTSADQVREAVRAQTKELTQSILGRDVQQAIASTGGSKADLVCQREVIKRAGKLLDAHWKAAIKSEKKLLAFSD
ncbi:hypothetical protein, partial [Roseobacter litoralis]|uniref:hypothetical protein n=1 Tax=Roseobacter litoralis TaxID=42443 RepID=UPI0024959185